MKGKLLLAVLLLTPLCCTVESGSPDDEDEAPSCETGCIEAGWCTYTEDCGCVPTMIQHCQDSEGCQRHGTFCCIVVSQLDGCAQCGSCP